MTPCNYLHTYLGYAEDSIHEACIADFAEQAGYLGPLDFVLYHTEETFISTKFDNDAVKRQSVLWSQQVDQFSPNWISTQI